MRGMLTSIVPRFLWCWKLRCSSSVFATWDSRNKCSLSSVQEATLCEIYCFSRCYQRLNEAKGKRNVSYTYKLLKSSNSLVLCGKDCGKGVSIKVFSLSTPPPFRSFLMLPFETIMKPQHELGVGDWAPKALIISVHFNTKMLKLLKCNLLFS